MRAPMPLIVRAGLSRTFGGLAAFAALSLLALGIYLLSDAFAHPVDAQAGGVIVAALAIAVAMVLFVFILKTRRFPKIFQSKLERTARERGDASAGLFAARRDRLRSDLPYQRTFVDRSCIPPRTPATIQARGIAGK